MIPTIHSAKSVSTKTLRSVWKKISDKPFPDVFAFTLDDDEFLSDLRLLQKTAGVIDTKVEEYGVDFSNKYIEACTFEFEGHMIIFVREKVPLIDALEHELKHVESWNLKKSKRAKA